MGKNILEIQNLTKYYGKTKGVENLSLKLEEGEIFGFIEPNGAGKSTTIRSIMNFMPESEEILDETVDYIIDCVDTVTAKIELVIRANKLNIPIISSMGTGNKLDPTRFEVTDIYQTSICPLAKVMRKELRTRGIKSLKVIYSKEEPIKLDDTMACSCKNGCICPPGTKRKCTVRNQVPGSISFVPSVAGLILAGEVIKDIIRK